MTATVYEFFCLHRKNLIFTFVRRNIMVKYRGSVLGIFWTLLIPMAQVSVYYFLYSVVLKIQVPHYLAFVVSGILPWLFFASTITESFESVVTGQSLLTQVQVPLQSFSFASVLTQMTHFLISLPVVFAVIALSHIPLGWVALLFLPLTAMLFLFTYSLAMIFSCLYVVFRDLKHLFGIVIQLWMYVTPVFYSLDMVPAQFKWIISLNPLTGYFAGIRSVLLDDKLPDWRLVAAFAAWTGILILTANLVRTRLGPSLVERL